MINRKNENILNLISSNWFNAFVEGGGLDSRISDVVLFLLRNLFHIVLFCSTVCVIASFPPGAIVWSVAGL